ncbi:MAG: GNAT family N-acetyltransferase [Flavobacteriales bacterium]|nr:GNAT family N-acetyltransferase [Flavobacteriales bacterium]MCB9167906.1 GNAT family N-acetyltransferase [Flavobacteriales bacterium]
MADPLHELRPIALGDAGIVAIARLLREVFPGARHFTEEVLRWQYVENPDGQAVGYDAWSGNMLAAHYVTIPLRAQVEDREELGLLSLNTATHPAHQGKGLFTRLANATYATAAERGFGFVVGVANTNSTHGFTHKLGFQAVGPLPALVGIGRIAFSEDPSLPGFAPVHDPAKLAWRLRHPAYRYTRAVQSGRTFILSQRTLKGARFILGVEGGGHAADALPEEPMPLLRSFIGLDPAIDRRRSLYVNVPMRFRPSPLNFIWKDLSGRDRKLEAGRVRFHAFDFDTL